MKLSLDLGCAWCKVPAYPSFVISDTAWQRITEEAEGLKQGSLCPLCVNNRLNDLGMRNVAIRFLSGAFAQE